MRNTTHTHTRARACAHHTCMVTHTHTGARAYACSHIYTVDTLSSQSLEGMRLSGETVGSGVKPAMLCTALLHHITPEPQYYSSPAQPNSSKAGTDLVHVCVLSLLLSKGPTAQSMRRNHLRMATLILSCQVSSLFTPLTSPRVNKHFLTEAGILILCSPCFHMEAYEFRFLKGGWEITGCLEYLTAASRNPWSL